MESLAPAPADPRELRAWLLYELGRRGLSYAEIGRRLGVSRQAVRRVFYQRYPRMEHAIADAIGRRPDQIWPDRYRSTNRPQRAA